MEKCIFVLAYLLRQVYVGQVYMRSIRVLDCAMDLCSKLQSANKEK